MRRYSEAIKADVRRRMHPPDRQGVARISEELGIHFATLYNWRKAVAGRGGAGIQEGTRGLVSDDN
jgi:transposase-like protein